MDVRFYQTLCGCPKSERSSKVTLANNYYVSYYSFLVLFLCFIIWVVWKSWYFQFVLRLLPWVYVQAYCPYRLMASPPVAGLSLSRMASPEWEELRGHINLLVFLSTFSLSVYSVCINTIFISLNVNFWYIVIHR